MVNRTPGDLIQSVLRGLSILETVAARQMPVRAQEIANSNGLQLATTYHLLNTLVYAGYLRKDGGTYTFSGRIAELYSALDRQLRPDPIVVAAIHRLAATTEETAYVSCWHQGDVTIAAVAEGRRAVRVTGLHIGVKGDANARASGKVLLAFGPPNRLDEYLAGNPLQRKTARTIVDLQVLRRELRIIRRRGYSIDREEFLDGVCCIAAPVLDQTGAASTALTVTVPATRFAQVLKGVSAAVVQEAADVTSSLFISVA